MKILYFGGQKSGKSRLAEERALALSVDRKPYYLAIYDSSYRDVEMQRRVEQHQKQRENRFFSIEERYRLSSVMKKGESYLIDCVSMWILNTLERELDEVIEEIERVAELESNVVFVLNDVNSGVIPMGSTSREFVDRTGVIGQKLASLCDEVYEVKFGLPLQLK